MQKSDELFNLGYKCHKCGARFPDPGSVQHHIKGWHKE